jgi:hypothetical protein
MLCQTDYLRIIVDLCEYLICQIFSTSDLSVSLVISIKLLKGRDILKSEASTSSIKLRRYEFGFDVKEDISEGTLIE